MTVAKQIFCFIGEQDLGGSNGKSILNIKMSELFFLPDTIIKGNNPEIFHTKTYNNQTISEISDYFIKFYSALWSSPVESLQNAIINTITNRLNNSLGYVSLHKRAVDGNCDNNMNNIDISTFSSLDLPMNDSVWDVSLTSHPLCQMPASFVKATMALHNLSSRPIFVAYDGQGDCEDLENINAVFTKSQAGDARCPTCHEASSLLESTKWIDMGVSLHAELFIHNPASTFSWMIFVVRSALGLKTVPSISDDYDLYLRHPHNNPAHLKWVNWKSIQARTEIFNNSKRYSQMN